MNRTVNIPVTSGVPVEIKKGYCAAIIEAIGVTDLVITANTAPNKQQHRISAISKADFSVASTISGTGLYEIEVEGLQSVVFTFSTGTVNIVTL